MASRDWARVVVTLVVVVGSSSTACGNDGGDGAPAAGGSAGAASDDLPAGQGASGAASGAAGSGGAAGAGDVAGGGGGPGSGGAGGTAGAAGAGGRPGGPAVRQIALGGLHGCALLDGGAVSCWGHNGFGQLGDGGTTSRLAAAPVRTSEGGPPLAGVPAVAVGQEHGCVPTAQGGVLCWGRNDDEQLSVNNAGDDCDVPTEVVIAPGTPLADVRAVVAGAKHACALTNGGTLKCWGRNVEGQLGDGSAFDHDHATTVLTEPHGAPLGDVVAVVVGRQHSCALVSGGEVRCWGDNDHGQLGDGTQAPRPTPVPVLVELGGPRLAGVEAIAAGDFHTCAVLNGGEARCWGFNGVGQLGDGSTADRSSPAPVVTRPGGPALGAVRAVAGGDLSTCAIVGDGGELRCWGGNAFGQLGDGTRDDHLTPVPVLSAPGGTPLAGAQALDLAAAGGCALLSGGEARCWGRNLFGRLGDGTTEDRTTPVPVVLP